MEFKDSLKKIKGGFIQFKYSLTEIKGGFIQFKYSVTEIKGVFIQFKYSLTEFRGSRVMCYFFHFLFLSPFFYDASLLLGASRTTSATEKSRLIFKLLR